MTQHDENSQDEAPEKHSCNCGHAHTHADEAGEKDGIETTEQEKTIPVKVSPHRFTPPIHGNRFGGTQNFRGNNQRPGRAAQRGR